MISAVSQHSIGAMDCYVTVNGSSVGQERTPCQNRTHNNQLGARAIQRGDGVGLSPGELRSEFESGLVRTPVYKQRQRKRHQFKARRQESVSQSSCVMDFYAAVKESQVREGFLDGVFACSPHILQ